jgi:hypothetical protein
VGALRIVKELKMPPIVIPIAARFALGVVGAAAVVAWAVKEVRRLNEDMARQKAASTIDPVTRKELPTLRRDPHSDEWRL